MDDHRKNVISLKDKRKERKAKKLSQSQGKVKKGGQGKWASYLQLILFIALLAYFMEQCR